MHFWLFFRQTNKLGVYTPHRDVYSARHSGSVAERLKAPVLKTGEAQVSVGANPTLSAMRKVKRKAYQAIHSTCRSTQEAEGAPLLRA